MTYVAVLWFQEAVIYLLCLVGIFASFPAALVLSPAFQSHEFGDEAGCI
jgi:hypothetical protein